MTCVSALRLTMAVIASASCLSLTAMAEDFHGFYVTNVGSESPNAETFATRNVDYGINSLLDVSFAATVRATLDVEGIGLIALDIPVPGSRWMGVDNARAGFRAGTYLAQSAVSRWGDGTVGAHTIEFPDAMYRSVKSGKVEDV